MPMVQICIFPNCNRDARDYDTIKPEKSTLRVAPSKNTPQAVTKQGKFESREENHN